MSKKSNDNEYYTPRAAIQQLRSALVRSKFPPLQPDSPFPAYLLSRGLLSKQEHEQMTKRYTVWECFGRDFDYIESPQYIKELGYDVIANGADFWTHNEGDFVISNPPYSTPRGERNIKERVLERLCSLKKPFCLLMPTTFLQTKCFKRVVDRYGKFQIVMPSTKIQFYQVDPDTREKVKKGKCSFYTAWFCWNMGFEKDFIMV